MTRVSTEAQADVGEGHSAQLHACQTIAKSNGFSNTEHVSETISGFTENIDDRPKLAKVLNEAQAGDILIWDKSDRIARDKKAKESILDEMAKKRLRCIVGGTEYDLTNEEHRLILTLFGGFDHYMGRALVARMKSGKEARQRKGGIIYTNAPFGLTYQPPKDSKNWEERTFVINPTEGKIVKKIFEKYLSGWSQEKIADWLNQQNITTRRGRRWTGHKISNLLKNPMIAGRVYANLYSYAPGTRSRKMNPQRDWQFVKYIGEIVPWSDFGRVQQRLERNLPPHRRNSGDTSKQKKGRTAKDRYFLADRLSCGKCNGKMGLMGGTKKPDGEYVRYYKCSWSRSTRRTRVQGKDWCESSGIFADHAEFLIWHFVRKVFLNPKGFFSDILKGNPAKAELINAKQELQGFESRLDTVNSKIEKAIDMLLETEKGSAREDTLNAQLKKLEKDRDSIKEQIARQSGIVVGIEQFANQLDFVKDNKEALNGIQVVARRVIDDLNYEQRKELVNAVLGNLTFKVETISKEEWKTYRKCPSGQFGKDLYVILRGVERIPTEPPKTRLEAIEQTVYESSLSDLHKIPSVGCAFNPRAKARGQAFKLVPQGRYNVRNALRDMARFAKSLKPRIYKKYRDLDSTKNNNTDRRRLRYDTARPQYAKVPGPADAGSCHEPLPMRLLHRPQKAVQMLAEPGPALPVAHFRAVD